MTDSIKAFVNIEHIKATEEEIISLPYQLKPTIDNYGEIKKTEAASLWFKSPLTDAKFQVTPVFQNKFAMKGELIGYEVSINVPACVVGNNALLQILPYGCSLFSVEFLKWYLLDAGCSVNIVKQIDLEHTTITELDLTYLLECESHNDAKVFNSKIEDYGDATLNTKHTNTKQRKPITTYSAAGLTTVTITKPRHFEAKSYVKIGPVPKSFESFPFTQVREAIYAESGSKVRLEFKANKNWLIAHSAESPLTWKNKSKATELRRKSFHEITDYLRVSDKLRSKRPKPDQIAKLSPAEQTILQDYFNGIAPKKHLALQGKSTQYFSIVKRKIEDKFRIDITIPWDIHSQKIAPDLPSWMQVPPEYEVPASLQDYCFVRETAKAKLKQLCQRNLQLIEQKEKDAATAAAPLPPKAKKSGNGKKKAKFGNRVSKLNRDGFDDQ